MPSTTSLATSTVNLEDFSAGASKIGFTKPWAQLLSPSLLEMTGPFQLVGFGWQRPWSEGARQHFIAYKGTNAFNVTSAAPLFDRVFAHLIVDALPDEAFPDVLMELGNAWDLYRPSEMESRTPQRPLVRGKVTRRYE